MMKMKLNKLIIGIPILVILAIPIFATVMPGDLRIYVGVGGTSANFYTCVNVKNPTYATDTEKFSPENVCFYYSTPSLLAGVNYETSTVGTQNFRLLSISSTTPAIAMFEFLSGAKYLKIFNYQGSLYSATGYFEPYFIETSPTGYIKLLFDSPGTYTIRYIAVDKALGPEPFVFYGTLLSKEEVLNEPPTVKILSPAPGTQLIATDVVNLIFQAIDPENRTMTCYYYVGGIENTISVLSGENVTIALKIDYLGNITIKVLCRDPFGLTGSASTYVIRESPPSSSIITPYANALVTNTSLAVTYMVADNGPYLVCNLSIVNTTISKVVNVTLPENGVAFEQTVLYLTDIPDGAFYTLKLVCNDSVGLQTQSQVTFEYALDPDRSERWCTSPEIGGEWYGDHCCGDDSGEYLSTDAKGYPTPQAFDPVTCSIIDLAPGQCDDDSDCPPSGWFCTNSTYRELRTYTCVKDAGQLIGTCQETILQYENCTAIDPSYICSNGVCTATAAPNQPPVITIHYPQDGQVINLTIYKNYITTNFTVTDDNSIAVVCNLTLNNNIINLGVLNVSQIYAFNVTGLVDGTNTLSVTCIDAYNNTTTVTVTFTVNTIPAECIVDTDCGVDSWQCVSATERVYIDYKCDAGTCVATVTATETAPTGYICMDGQFVSESTLTCTSDADCPPDDRVCTQDGTGYMVRDWYCDLNTRTCKYNITQTVSCGANQYCLAGACWDKGETACEGLIITYCTSNTTYTELVAVYREDLGTCVYLPAGTFNCPTGTVCFAGKCSTTPTANLPPVINYQLSTKQVKVGEAAEIIVEVTDDNTPVLFVNVTVQAPEIIQLYKGVATAGKPFRVYYVPPHASTHVLTISATDQYGVVSTVQDTIEVTEEAVTAPAPTAEALPTGGVGGGATAAALAGAVAKPTVPIWLALAVGVIVVGAAIYVLYLRR